MMSQRLLNSHQHWLSTEFTKHQIPSVRVEFELEDMEHKISDTAFNVFDEVRLQGEHTDVIIKVQDTRFRVHKIILCGCSPYFR